MVQFANAMTNRLLKFMSPCPDGQAMAIHALVSPGPDTTWYEFPATTIFDKVMIKIQQEKPKKLLLIAPGWPITTWF